MRISTNKACWSLFFFLATFSPLHAQEKSPQEIEESCGKYMQSFYNSLVQESEHPSRKDHKFQLTYSPELRRRLKEDDEAREKNTSGDIVGLDFEPIWMGQDLCTRYVVGKVKPKGNHYLVEVYCIEGSKKKKDYMEHEVMFTQGRWMIMNIHYYYFEKDKPPRQDDLLNILKELREERRKNSK